LEKLLLTSAQSKGPIDQNVRLLRDNIIKLYESILLENHEFAEAHEVEQSLWRLHYTQIEEFRSRIRKSLPPVPSSNTTSLSSTGSKNIVKRETNQKILAVFRSFLSEATGFYHDLVLKIRAKHGLPQDDFTCTAVESKNGRVDDKRVQELKRCQLSCHRCLIYLGDLARYKEIHGDSSGQGDAKIHDWSIAAGFYVKAASIWPASGNPHNQVLIYSYSG
jgi:protein SMG7